MTVSAAYSLNRFSRRSWVGSSLVMVEGGAPQPWSYHQGALLFEPEQFCVLCHHM